MRTITRIALCALLAGCARAPEKPAAPPPPQPPPASVPADPAPNDNLNAVTWTQNAIEHDLIYREVYRVAGEKLRAALKDPTWDALPNRDRTRIDLPVLGQLACRLLQRTRLPVMPTPRRADRQRVKQILVTDFVVLTNDFRRTHSGNKIELGTNLAEVVVVTHDLFPFRHVLSPAER